jgi:hypothetical protein
MRTPEKGSCNAGGEGWLPSEDCNQPVPFRRHEALGQAVDRLTISSSSNTTPSLTSLKSNFSTSSIPGKMSPASHFGPFSFSVFSWLAIAMAILLGGLGLIWCSVGKVLSDEREKRSEGKRVLQNVQSNFLSRQPPSSRYKSRLSSLVEDA